MIEHRKLSKIFLLLILATSMSSATLLAQSRTTWRTKADVRNGVAGVVTGTVSEIPAMRSFSIRTDPDDVGVEIEVQTDSVSTRYQGFGVSDPALILTGSEGFSKVRVGDRVEIRGVGQANSKIRGESVRLLGRPVESTSAPFGRTVEGVIRSTTAGANRITVETSKREIVTIAGDDETPVYYQGKTYRIRNLEVGDRVRVEVEKRNDNTLSARVIDVTASVSESFGDEPRDDRTFTSLSGEITRVDAKTKTFRMSTNRNVEVRVDAKTALDVTGRELRFADLRVGDRVVVSGVYDRSDIFKANTVRLDDELDDDGEDDDPISDDEDRDYTLEIVTMQATVVDELAANTLRIRDETTRRAISVYADADLAVRLKNGSYTTASRLKIGDRITVRAFRDRDKRLFAQTIRTR